MHEPLQRRNPVKQAQLLPWQVPSAPQSASAQQALAGRHCLPHLTFGALHFFFFFFFFASPSPWPRSGSAPAAASSAVTPRRVCDAPNARASRSNCEPSITPPPEIT
jgi:hypothetical protein